MKFDLSTVLQGVSNVLSFKKKVDDTVLGLDFGSSALKVVQLKKDQGKVKLETYGAIALGPYEGRATGDVARLDKDKLIQAGKDLLADSKVTTKRAWVSIPASSSLVFVLSLPKVDQSQLSAIIPNEARRYIPIPLTEVSLDWWVIPTQANGGEDNKIEVLVAAIRNEALTMYQDVVTGLGLEIAGFEIEVFSNMRSMFKNELAPVLLLDIGASTSRAAIVEYGVVKNFHTISLGAAAFSQSLAQSLQIPFYQAEERKKKIGLAANIPADQDISSALQVQVNRLSQEVQQTILDFEKTYNKGVSKALLTGGGSALLGLKENLAESLSLAEIVIADPFSRVENPAFLNEVLRYVGPEFSVALGIALKGLQE